MGGKKYQLAINATAFMIDKLYKIWEDEPIPGTLLIDVKRIFDYVTQAKLVQRIKNLGIDNDLIS